MRYRGRIFAAAITAMVMVMAMAVPLSGSAQAEENAVSDGMTITSCRVDSAKKTGDCAAAAAQICNGKNFCEIQIGYNLTEGRDIDPAAGVTGKKVTITYACGPVTRQRGPYIQNDHATLFLECFGPL